MEKSKKTESLIELYKNLRENNLPEEYNEKYISRYLDKKARAMGVPLHGCFELTPLCNLDCKMCYVHLDNKQFKKELLLSTKTWKDLINQAHASGMMKAALTGGECLTYPGFDEIYLHLYSIGIIPSVLSNGVLLDDARIAFFMEYPPRRLQVTLYGSTDEAYELVTGRKLFNKVYDNLIKVREAGLPLVISITPNAYMKADMKHLIERVESLGVPYFINSSLKPPREITGRKEEDLTTEEYIELFRIQHEIRHIPVGEVDDIELPDVNQSENSVYGLRCGAGRSGFSITYDGNMCPCFSLHFLKAKPLEIGFQKAWGQVNSMANNYLIPSECTTCVYRDVCITCPAVHISAPVSGHCDPRICERTKKMIRAGIISMPKTV